LEFAGSTNTLIIVDEIPIHERELKALEIGIVGGLPVVVMPEALLGLRCSRQREAQREAGFAICGLWG